MGWHPEGDIERHPGSTQPTCPFYFVLSFCAIRTGTQSLGSCVAALWPWLSHFASPAEGAGLSSFLCLQGQILVLAFKEMLVILGVSESYCNGTRNWGP